MSVVSYTFHKKTHMIVTRTRDHTRASFV